MALHYLLYDTTTGLTQRGEVEGTGGGSNPIRTDETVLTSSSFQDFTHNFGMSISDLKVVIYENDIKISEEQQAVNYSITQVDTNTIRVTNISGNTKTFFAYIWGFNINQILGRFNSYTKTTSASFTGLINTVLRSNETAMIRYLISARKDGTTANSWELLVQAENNASVTTVTEISRTYFEDVPEMDVRVIGAGNEVRLEVAGQSGVDIEWYCVAETTHF